MFCRQAVADLARLGPAIDAEGTQLAFVHMGTEDEAKPFFATYRMDHVPRVSDPQAALYREFGLVKGGVTQVLGASVWTRGVKAFFSGGHTAGKPIGDPWQMPGAFLVRRGKVLKAFRHESSSDVPDYAELASCPLPARK